MQINKQDEKLFQELLKKYKQGTISGFYPGSNITFAPTGCRDKIISSTGGDGGGVDSVNGQTGVVVLDTSNINDSIDKRYVTDADLVILGNTSGINSGNETATSIGTLINSSTGAISIDTGY